MRNRFDEQLCELHNSIIKMGEMCCDAIELAANALINHINGDRGDNIEKAIAHTLETDREIDRTERDIETLCLKLLLQQQPVAKDLRRISAALKMISDMERIGDQASDIAEIIRYISVGNTKHKIHINEMSSIAGKMVRESVSSYIDGNILLASRVIQEDDELDRLFCLVKNEIIEEISNGVSDCGECIDLLMIAKYLERIGDHATNIAEWAEYSVCGIHRSSEIKDL